jgi:hypothetical protein
MCVIILGFFMKISDAFGVGSGWKSAKSYIFLKAFSYCQKLTACLAKFYETGV